MDLQASTGATDAQLLASRDSAAFGEFYLRHRLAVMAFLVRRVGSVHTAADLTSETFATAFEQRRRYRADLGTGRSWVLGIAANKFRRFVRHAEAARRTVDKHGAVLHHGSASDSLAGADERVAAATVRVAVARRLAMLPPTLQDAIVLRVVEGLPYADVAAELGCTAGAARVRVCRALAILAADEELASSWLSTRYG